MPAQQPDPAAFLPTPEFPLIHLGQVPSALDSALALARDGTLPPFGCVLADSQTMGRGQLRRRWHSPPGNLYAGIRLPPDGIFAGTAASVRIGLILAEAMSRMGFPIRVKWPNDLVLMPRDLPGQPGKVGGVLLEERGETLLAGIGINLVHAALPDADPIDAVPQSPGDAHVPLPPAHLASLGISVPEPEILCRHLVKALNSAYALEAALPDQWLVRVQRLLLWLGERVTLTDGETGVQGRLTGLTREGTIVLDVDGRSMEFAGGTLRR